MWWKKRRIWAGGAAVVLFCVVLALGILLRQGLPILNGYAAKVFSSGVFVGRRPMDDVFSIDVTTKAPRLRWELDRADSSVAMSIGGWFPRSAVFIEGLGVTLVPPGLPSVEFDTVFAPSTIPALDGNQPWPRGASEALGEVSAPVRLALDEAVDWAFSEPDPASKWQTRAVVVAQQGALVAERYGEGSDRDTPLLGWSMTKSVTSALTGTLVHAGKLDIHASASVPEWEEPEDPRHKITLDMLLRMSSGLAFEEDYLNPYGDALIMLYLQGDMGGYAASKPLTAPPGTQWSYSSGTTNLICRIMRGTFGGPVQDYFNYPRTALFNKLGMRSAVIEPDASGTFVGSSYMYATARDWARFGQFYLQDGVWNGERILPEGWVNYSTTPTPTADRGRYGAHWWLNVGDPPGSENRPFPALPGDLYFASGHEGQFVVVVPSHQAVIVRLGVTSEGRFDLEGFVRRVLDALDARL